MNRIALITATLALVCASQAFASLAAAKPGSTPPASEVARIFERPQALLDQNGKPIITRRGAGHPVPYDWNGDGKTDLLLGCKLNLNTSRAEVLLIENVGTKENPAFKWPASLKAGSGNGDSISANCGCKSGGTFEIHPTDWDGDGHFDIVVSTRSSGKQGVFIMYNTGTSKTTPTFTRGGKYLGIRNHGKGSGSGDWNNDGIEDFAHYVNMYGWHLYLGKRGPHGGVSFSRKRVSTSLEYKMVGQDPLYGKIKDRPSWFHLTPCAWDFSRQNPVGGKRVEIVASMQTAAYKREVPYAEKVCHINLYLLDHETKTCTFRGRVAENKAASTRVGMGDLNGDGSMDVLYTGGIFSKGDETKIYVCYGKVKNLTPSK